MVPIIALVGRPNVGKSTLFNRLTKTREALVANFSGLTRDRKYGEGELDGKPFIVIDTGGLSAGKFSDGSDNDGQDSDAVAVVMAEQAQLAIAEADIVMFMLDCRDGLTHTDQVVADYLRKENKTTILVANKIDGLNHDLAVAPFFELGMGEVHGVAASHGRGVASLLAEVLKDIPEQTPKDEEQEDSARGIKMSVVGRPNVGKSTLVNRMLGEERVVVFDLPGTTRDSIYIDYERDGKTYTLIDTAGVRRRKNVKLPVEKFSIVKTLQAISDSHVAILVLDASEGIVDQDLHLMGHIIESGRALVVALNKWDGLEEEHKSFVKTELTRRLRFIDFADIHYISALHGSGVGKLYNSIEKAYKSATERFSTHRLTQLLEDAVATHQPPMVRGRRIKLRYAHLGGHNPPRIVIHGNQTDSVPDHYVKFLEKTFRRALKLHGTPVKIEFKSGDNPFAGKKNKLTERQVSKKRRLIKHAKKK